MHIINITQYSGAAGRTDEPTMRHHNHPESKVTLGLTLVHQRYKTEV